MNRRVNGIKAMLISAFGLILTAGIITSCSFGNESKEKGNVASVNFSVGEISRNVYPVVDKNEDLLITKISYKTATGTEQDIMSDSDGKKIAELEVYEDIPAGEELTFVAYGKIGQLSYKAVTVQTLRAGVSNTVSLCFKLAGTNDSYEAAADEKGDISIGIKIKDSHVAKVTAKLSSFTEEIGSEDAVVIDEKNVVLTAGENGELTGVYSLNDVPAGAYRLLFSVYSANNLLLAPYSEIVNVVKGKTTRPQDSEGNIVPIVIDNINDIYSISYKNFNPERLAAGIVLTESCTRFSVIDLPGADVISNEGLKTFGGWYTTADCSGEAVTVLSDVRKNVVLYAKWIKVPLDFTKITITGTPKTGATLTADYRNGDNTGSDEEILANVTFQWYRGETPIPGATSSSYALVEEDGNKTVTVKITAKPESDYEGTVSNTTSTILKVGDVTFEVLLNTENPFGLENDTALKTLKVTGTKDTYTYKWFIDGVRQAETSDTFNYSSLVDDSAETSSCYEVAVEVKVKAGSTVKASAVVRNLSPMAAGNAGISGNLAEGETLTALYNGTPADTTYITFQWYRADTSDETEPTAISGATGATYTITAADNDKYIYVELTGDGVRYAATSGMAVINAKIHAHTFAREWTHDEGDLNSGYHWHEATCGHTEEISNYGSHRIDYRKISDELCEPYCENCGLTGTPRAHQWHYSVFDTREHTKVCDYCLDGEYERHTMVNDVCVCGYKVCQHTNVDWWNDWMGRCNDCGANIERW